MNAEAPIQRRKLYQEVELRLPDRIRGGDFGPGSQLPSERDLMEHYGVGRPAVREALQSLERSGIVEIVQGSIAAHDVEAAERAISEHLTRASGLYRR